MTCSTIDTYDISNTIKVEVLRCFNQIDKN